VLNREDVASIFDPAPYIRITTARPLAHIGDVDADCAPAFTRKGSNLQQRNRTRQPNSLGERLQQEAKNLRRQAHEMPSGVRKDELLRKARQADTGSHINEWLSSPGLLAPE
jgi:hypothetical protein